MKRVGKVLLLLLLVPALYVASAVVAFPAVLWHGVAHPRSSALMEIRARAAGDAWERRHRWVPLDSIAPDLARAVLAAEDTRFYDHSGFDWEQIGKAWRANRRRGGAVRGASTITQQVVKNLYLSPSRNVMRKAREALLTAWMEVWLPKDRILELYLNVVELGPGVFGAEAAARKYFGRPADDLSRSQAALLAATLPAPLDRNPAASTPGLRRRQAMILSRLGQWYQGPSLAAEEAIGAEPGEPPRGPERRAAVSLEEELGALGEAEPVAEPEPEGEDAPRTEEPIPAPVAPESSPESAPEAPSGAAAESAPPSVETP